MKIKSNLKVGGFRWNHNQTAKSGLKVKSNFKVAGPKLQHNQTVRAD